MSDLPPIVYAENFLLHNVNIHHGFGTKILGDNIEHLSQLLSVNQNQIVRLKQVHSQKVVLVESGFNTDNLLEADALVTDQPGFVLVIQTADCLPILIADPKQNVVAAVHAGWRGLVKQILEETIEVMNHRWGCDVQDLQVSIGPSIQPENYEVSEDVFDAFRETFGMRFAYEKLDNGKAVIDLAHTAGMHLEQLGLHPRNFFFVNEGTYARPDLFHSYRRDHEDAGRQLSFIALK